MVPSGQGLIRTARILDEEGFITDRDIFKAGVMLLGEERNLKAGEFLIPATSSMRDIMDILVKGEVIQHSVTIPEGWTSYQIVEYLNELFRLSGENRNITIRRQHVAGNVSLYFGNKPGLI